MVCVFFFFKQKTADEMRISDWSSDVCSSDLTVFAGETVDQYFGGRHAIGEIIERITAAGGAVEMDVRRGIEARGPERHAGEIGLVHEVGERQRLAAAADRPATEHDFVCRRAEGFGGHGGQPAAEDRKSPRLNTSH